jgi:hypothetical protein
MYTMYTDWIWVVSIAIPQTPISSPAGFHPQVVPLFYTVVILFLFGLESVCVLERI